MPNKKTIVISLGGSQIIPDNVNYQYLSKFKKVINKNKRNHKFVIVCGGGSLARNYISALNKAGKSSRFQSLSGISATRSNARFVNYFFGKEPKKGLPTSINQVKKKSKRDNLVICGALGYNVDSTSDSDAARLARELKGEFVNLTNVDGLYDKNPKKNKGAKLIKKISWKEFDKKAQKLKYKPGQHFVLDQSASKIIKKNKIPTYIIKSPSELDNLIKGKKFRGTEIKG